MKKLFAILLAVALVLSLAACAPAAGSNETTGTEESILSFTVVVVHKDGTSKDFTYETEEEMLGNYLESQGLIVSEGADEGMFHTVDGEKAVYAEDNAYWAFYLGEEYAMTGIYDTAISDGAVYKLVYTGA